MMRQILYWSFILTLMLACQSGGGGSSGLGGGKPGSQPVNSKEERAYKRALLKCYKTGGSRIVKIEGKLRCY